MKKIKKISNCSICNGKIVKALNLGMHPLCDDLIKINSKKISQEYPVNIYYCKVCIIAYQRFIVDKKILFPKTYHYRGKLTKDVVNGQAELVKDIKKKFKNIKYKNVLDIGCNDGALLDFFRKEKCRTIGVEPTNAALDASKKHKIYNQYFDEKLAREIKKKFKKIDFITFTNVFAHINDLGKLLKALKILLTDTTTVIVENHYLGSIIRLKQFDSFYHEHPRTYSLQSLIQIGKKISMKISNVSFPKRYGGNIRVIFEKETSKKFTTLIKKEYLFFNSLKRLKNDIWKWRIKKRKLIKKLVKKFGPLPAKAFPGRAAILIKLLNLSDRHISAVYEQPNSKKISYYVPGTRIKIISDIYLKKNLKEKIPIINLAWHISSEIRKYLKLNKIKSKIIDIVNNKDF